jgi:hypothetical protein
VPDVTRKTCKTCKRSAAPEAPRLSHAALPPSSILKTTGAGPVADFQKGSATISSIPGNRYRGADN